MRTTTSTSTTNTTTAAASTAQSTAASSAARRRLAALAVPVAALAMLTTACGGDDDNNNTALSTPGAASSPAAGEPSGDPSAPASPGTSTRPARPGATATPAGQAQLRAALLNDQEIPSDYEGGSVTIPENEENPPPSDPRCTPLLSPPPEVAAVEREYTPAEGSTVEGDDGVTITLTSYRSEDLDRAWPGLEKAARECREFTLPQGTIDLTYTIAPGQVVRQGDASVSMAVTVTDGEESLRADMVYVRVGNVVAKILAQSSGGAEPHLPAVFVNGQVEKLIGELDA